MKYPQDAMSQQHLVGHLRELIDRCRRLEEADTPTGINIEHAVKHVAAEAMLNAMLDLNPHASGSTHVLHNLGRARRAWLEQFQLARAGASATSIPATRSSPEET